VLPEKKMTLARMGGRWRKRRHAGQQEELIPRSQMSDNTTIDKPIIHKKVGKFYLYLCSYIRTGAHNKRPTVAQHTQEGRHFHLLRLTVEVQPLLRLVLFVARRALVRFTRQCLHVR
jgi:hypothetical protein